jgi:sulfoxide reductase catalytic subunit YedY
MDNIEFALNLPAWVTITHFVNVLFITLLMRSGIQILGDHPRLYLDDHCTPGSEWIKFTKKKVPTDRYYTSLDDAVNVSPVIGLPGGHHTLGLARFWHFMSVFFWILNGFIYAALLFGTGQWRRLIPTSLDIFPRAIHTLHYYLTYHLPPISEFRPYDPLQQLAYGAVVFILGPLAILTGAAMSPALAGRFPWYTKLFGGRQKARSIHFLVLVGFLQFLIIHVSLVVITGFKKNMTHIIFGTEKHPDLAVAIGLGIIAFIVLIHIAVTIWSQKRPRSVQQKLGVLTNWMMKSFLYKLKSKQNYTKKDISPYFWVNGYPPEDPNWIEMSKNQFRDYKLKVYGQVSNPLQLSLDDLRKLNYESNITKHCCIQGWSGVGEWTGIPVRDILTLCQPLPSSKYIIFHSYQKDDGVHEYYSSLDLEEAKYPQCILAYEMNGETLSISHGAPLRLRVESKLGFKMVKWIRSIEIVDDFRTVGLGYGGFREDFQFFDRHAQI